jgi:diadenosine tetraphosphatase ApaH/serine/threonine PP2A family protein phosphatase
LVRLLKFRCSGCEKHDDLSGQRLRYLVLSDLHANVEALEAVVGDAQGQYDRIVCCGDLAGYGPDPNPVIDWVRENVSAVVRGNHDRACAGLEDLDGFNPVARAASVWTTERLTEANLEYLRELAAGPMEVDGFLLAHGSPEDEDEYLMTLMDAAPVLSRMETTPVFFGHTHLQGGFTWMNGRFERAGRPRAELLEQSHSRLEMWLDPDAAWLVNPGSVGQPRDEDWRAAYALFDSGSRVVALCRTRYDCGKTARKIIAGGLPDMLAARLRVGR